MAGRLQPAYRGPASGRRPGDRDIVSVEASVEKNLNKNIFDPRPSVIFSSNRIIDCILILVVVMIGTNKLGKPKWDA